MRPKKTALHLEDLLIVLNFVNANESFKESEYRPPSLPLLHSRCTPLES